MDLDLSIDPELMDEIARHIERERQSSNLRLQPGSQELVPAGDALRKKLERYIDFDAGGLKLLDLQIDGRPARFLLIPDIGNKTIWLQFQYRF